MSRTFKTRWFQKNAKKIGISDADLCKAADQARKGQAEDLGGGVFKKRLHDNEYRSILLAKGGKYWIFTFIFPKQDKKNLEDDELEDFKKLAKSYEKVDEKQLATLLNKKDLVEICCESKDKIQK
ncbi:TPA: type II toxin-antitoxin system RelE/ParE family toxin [Stenotrophomonas maltophilia]|uniref:type II toxin-antitoxin system RelE/ParE family toxin n=1 Tax=Stenotrophomonas TaxID=40323 RepID=UPI000978A8E7|nr:MULTISPECIES: type II toxin-antitoxin system RelE/ParE family toxin [Stenotrophomonas]MCV4214526.1 type II toxin-antitoxin system RelE/ParE family toxin [Pseudomonas cichorii]MBH1465626.1 type II toxin-antitoxin system RelE/ParE family toxin [Stenotrophomonas maltophilia]MBH1612227.1 type II toxin-antitoxin system RelE/ParE family toxin [Stenotrophomonas maltophilia]MBN5083917.1 type II toxin-antitoxin system RelE/ParE family toxin [Stenotrophomonas maltophilia]MBN5167931.1 type II toxin-an